MLVTFKTKAYANITMFGDVAAKLLELMGHSGAVPGSIPADSVGAALARLKAGIARVEEDTAPEDAGPRADDAQDEERPVTLKQRAWPLIELLEAADKANEYVLWEN